MSRSMYQDVFGPNCDFTHRNAKLAVKWLVFLLHIQIIPCSNLGPEIVYCD
jgi:hypothetical protein